MGTDTDPDSGLLSPVRAGTPVEPVTGDRAWLQAMLDAEAGLARAQARLGTVPVAAAEAIGRLARAERLDLVALARQGREAANPVVGLVRALTAVVADQAPEAAEYVHRGSTSQDVLDTGAMLVAQRAIRVVLPDLDRTLVALARLAAEHRDSTMAGRTLSLQAVPTTFGLKAAGWHELVRTARERLAALAEGGLPVQLGGAAGTLAGYLEYAEGVAEDPRARADYVRRLTDTYAAELGLAAPALPWHVLRTPIADLGAACALLTGALGKIAVDVQSMGRTEVGELAEPAVSGRGRSSAMPHKRNPVLATLIRSAALQVPVLSAGLAQCMLAEDERSAGAWHAEWQLLRECLRLAGGAAHLAAELTEGLEVHPERMRANLDLTAGQLVSERIAARLAPLLGRGTAQELLNQASGTAAREGRTLGEVLTELPEVRAELSDAELADLLDPARYTGAAAALADRAQDAVGERSR
ncbi:3-carboxy-cis,cis-muconate cycloisomerase [Kitasatospora sp. NBC_01287]|uniref:3-carboxy-cis,cis-muconate cycloisomerase n=1 Tax=Kitasatospora sp. NBC_01287 TaxID=2903573 RepID=UPI002255D56D|nr:3-carboxy-cis,cis-muconate cycloisomerase [Kitasatospora sp. NBC_01287]MCX4747178.1 3-carboxy-cis,cis-muconate cycloisomerase [Kitasatospora sp. NBC_01287]